MYKCEILADSECESSRLTTMLVTYPRIIHAEMTRHRAFSRNTSSHRAIPFKWILSDVKSTPFIPLAWQKTHTGMQGREYVEDKELLEAKWLEARDAAVEKAIELDAMGVTKQLVNRILEPYLWVTEIISGTTDAYVNFFNLRCPKYDGDSFSWKSTPNQGLDHDTTPFEKRKNSSLADVHIQIIAEMMYDAYTSNKPIPLEPGGWHIPFYKRADKYHRDIAIKVSVARCARLSYKTLGSDRVSSAEEDIKLHNMLLEHSHMSPFEHIARATGNQWKYANYRGFRSYRYDVENKTFMASNESLSKIASNVIFNVLGVSVNENTRNRAYVDARAIFYKILKENGYSITAIGKEVGRHHASVIHGLNLADNLSNDRRFMIKYNECLAEFNSIINTNNSRDYSSMASEIFSLKETIKELNLYREKYLELTEK